MKSLIIVAVAALSCVAFAEGAPEGGARPEGGRRGFGHREGMGPMMGGMDPIVRMVSNPAIAEKIGLSDEQKAKLNELKKGPEVARESQKKVHEAMEKQIELMKAEKIDEAAVMAAIDEVFELRKAMAKEQAKRVIAVKSVLTPEQVKKAHEEMKKMFESRGDRGLRREGKGPREFKGPRKGPHGEKGPQEGPKDGPKEGCDTPAPAPEAK
ncbi:MAG: Spy/CpxP family protein refolding chaperone [Kiritimatiellae bacterium]|nr:Spy/CpxP family protein refolding chaperone [Kiritimatiellia bacterium]